MENSVPLSLLREIELEVLLNREVLGEFRWLQLGQKLHEMGLRASLARLPSCFRRVLPCPGSAKHEEHL